MLIVSQWIPFLNTPLTTRLWRMAIAILSGVCGNLILIFFLSGLLAGDTLVNLFDWIVGFNAALTGYMLVEKNGAKLNYWRYFSAGAGLVNVLITILAISQLFTLMAYIPFMDIADLGILLTIGAICSALGGALAKKYLEIKKEADYC